MTDVSGLRELTMQAGLAGLRETSEQRNLKSLAKSAKAVSAAVERVASAQEKRAE